LQRACELYQKLGSQEKLDEIDQVLEGYAQTKRIDLTSLLPHPFVYAVEPSENEVDNAEE
jgi:hypothetical protein